ncbi:MAG: Orotidine 5'-phosphate decarboxylase [Phycisphaerae bacterium]|nr:Orotidine 5'-phosphate decarboxylase [Phycisphaerae bacterium]
MGEHFADALLARIRELRAPAAVGLDPLAARLPPELRVDPDDDVAAAAAFEAFGRGVIDTVAPLVPAIKINSAFFEAQHEHGVAAYFRLIAHARQRGLLVIGDVKRGDIGSTAALYARGHLSGRAAPDAVTLAGYLGENAVRPFVDVCRAEQRGVFVLVRPSDPGADEVHEFAGAAGATPGSARPFYRHMASLVARWGSDSDLIGRSGYSCVGAVVAAKDAASTRALRDAMPGTLFLVPGYGAQGATAEACRNCLNADGLGAIVNASRSVIFAYLDAGVAERGGGDWRRCVRLACEDFVADLRRAGLAPA